MTGLVETPVWEPEIYQWETDDPVEGGPDGIDNVPTRQLANRSQYLKQEVESAQAAQGAHAADADPHPQYAPKLNPVLTAPTVAAAPGAGDNSLKLVPSAWVVTAIATAIADLVASSPAALNTLNEIAAALGNDANFAATITNALALKAPLASPAFTGSPTAPTAADLSAALEIVNAAFLAKRAGSQGAISGDRNRIINGSCQVVNISSVASVIGQNTFGGPELFPAQTSGTPGGQFTQSQGSLTFGGLALPTVRQTVNTAITSMAGASLWGGLLHHFEGFNVFDLQGKPVALSFVFNTNLSGTYSVALVTRNAAGTVTQSYVTTIVAVANTPQQVSIPIAAIPAGAALPNTNGLAMQLRIAPLNQGGFQTATLNQWQAAEFFAATGTTNWGATAGNFIEATSLQLEEGAVATPFIRRPYGQELFLTGRYFEKSFDMGTDPGAGYLGAYDAYGNRGAASGSTARNGSVPLVKKRALPTIAFYSPATGATGKVRAGASDKTVSAVDIGMGSFRLNITDATATADDICFQWTAAARL